MKNKKIYIIIILFFILSLFNLGNFYNFPVTGIKLEPSQEIIIKLTDSIKKNKKFYMGIYSAEVFGNPIISYSIDGKTYKKSQTKSKQFLANFYLAEFKEDNLDINYIKLETEDDSWYINEFTLFSTIKSNEKDLSIDKVIIYKESKDFNINITSLNNEKYKLFDENKYIFRKDNKIYRLNIPEVHNYTGFDEMIYKLTPNEIINNIKFYENTHPPLGKLITTIGVYIFGYNFFGIRIMSVIFNILLLWLIYIFVYKLTNNYNIANIATILFGCDFLRYTIGRLCTIGNFDIFFILLSFYFMFNFYTHKLSENIIFNNKDYFDLFFSGIFIGLAISCKWTGFYAAIGLAILFFIAYFTRINKLNLYNFQLLLTCILFFIIIPISIYSLSYLFFYDGTNSNFIIRMLSNQEFILKHHTIYATIEEGVSNPYLWPLDIGAMTSLSARFNDSSKALSIILWSNPFICLLSIPMIILSLYNIIFKKDKINLFLIISGLSVYVPWLFINRPLYIYHFYLFIPFLILMICYNFYKLKINIKFLYFYLIINIIVFIIFFPILNGIYMPIKYFELLNKIPFLSNLFNFL